MLPIRRRQLAVSLALALAQDEGAAPHPKGPDCVISAGLGRPPRPGFKTLQAHERQDIPSVAGCFPAQWRYLTEHGSDCTASGRAEGLAWLQSPRRANSCCYCRSSKPCVAPAAPPWPFCKPRSTPSLPQSISQRHQKHVFDAVRPRR